MVTAENAGPFAKGRSTARLLGGPEVEHYHQALALVVAETFEQARAAAFEDARAKAEQYASLAGRPLGPVLRVTEQPERGIPVPRFAAANAAIDAGAGMPVEAGESTVTATVTVRFSLR